MPDARDTYQRRRDVRINDHLRRRYEEETMPTPPRRWWRRYAPTFRLHGDPPNGTWMPLAVTQIFGGRSWSLAITRLGAPVAEATAIDGACHSVWCHGDDRWLTKNMTSEQREAFADAVDRDAATLDPDEPATIDRWWRDA